MKETLIQVSSSYFTAGAVAHGLTIVRAAPIIHYCKGWSPQQLLAYCNRKGWHYSDVTIQPTPQSKILPS